MSSPLLVPPRRRAITLPALALGLLLPTRGAEAQAQPAAAWEVVDTADGVTVARRAAEGSATYEWKATAIVDAPLARVVATLDDADTRRAFNSHSEDSREVERSGLGKVVTYDRINAPWPVAPRDLLVAVDFRVEVAAGDVRIAFHEVTRRDVPPVPGVVRMPLARGHYLMWPRDRGQRTKVEYLVHYELGGDVPAWVANAIGLDTAQQTVQALRRFAQQRRPGPVEKQIEQRPDYRALMARTGQ